LREECARDAIGYIEDWKTAQKLTKGKGPPLAILNSPKQVKTSIKKKKAKNTRKGDRYLGVEGNRQQ